MVYTDMLAQTTLQAVSQRSADCMFTLQAVRDFLAAGPVGEDGRLKSTMTQHYVAQSKLVQAGHHSVRHTDVAKMIASPVVQTYNALLNTPLAMMCDVVHWGMCDLAEKFVDADKQVCTQL
jgi:hypothetical protein